MAITDPTAMTITELLDAYTDPWFITSQKQAMRAELLRRLSAGNPQSEQASDIACRCCGRRATRRIGSALATCYFCEDHCRAPGPVDTNWYHGTIAPKPEDDSERCEREWKVWSKRNDIPETADAARYAWSAAWETALEPERNDERVEEIKCTKCGQLVLLSQRLLIEWPAEVKCVQDSAMCDGAVRLVPYCEEHDPRKGSR